MGKKSRRPNRNKPKDIPAAASTAVAAPRQVITSDVATFFRLFRSRDWAGMLQLESEMPAIASRDEGSNPGRAGSINLMLGAAHKEMGREGGIEEATLYFNKAIEMAKKAGDKEILTDGVVCLAQCYLKMGRVQEAMDLYKSLCEEIGKESMDPNPIIEFAQILKDHHENSRALTILEEHLEAIESSWKKREQCRAYEIIAFLYCRKNDFAKSNVYFERQLPIVKETKNLESEFKALNGIGHNYGCMSDYGNAMAYLDQALVIESELGGDSIGTTFCTSGDVLVAHEGREEEAILMFQKCVGLFAECNEDLIRLFLRLGHAYTQIKAWDEAIAYLEKSISIADSLEDERRGNQLKAGAKQDLGNTYLEKYESHPGRNDELAPKLYSGLKPPSIFNLPGSES